MSDLFHKDVPDSYIKAVLEVMNKANWHTYQVLTKRPDRMCKILSSKGFKNLANKSHIWWGVSVEDRKHGLPRIDLLRKTPVAVRFLSVEPLLEGLGKINLAKIDWVIVGGESGPGARPLEKEWVTSIQQQCEHAGVPFFFKQWGGIQKSKAGRELNGRTYDEFPERLLLNVPPTSTRQKYIEELSLSY